MAQGDKVVITDMGDGSFDVDVTAGGQPAQKQQASSLSDAMQIADQTFSGSDEDGDDSDQSDADSSQAGATPASADGSSSGAQPAGGVPDMKSMWAQEAKKRAQAQAQHPSNTTF